jgi:hypothetical protein
MTGPPDGTYLPLRLESLDFVIATSDRFGLRVLYSTRPEQEESA